MGTSLISFVIVLGVLIFFHELGHFLVARFFGVGVEKFSLGFGPKILGRKIGLTEYRLSAIPLGGYVKMMGDEPDADVEPADIPFSFTHKHVLKRIAIVAAGPIFNLLLAVLIFGILFWISGSYVRKPAVGTVEKGSPAEIGGVLSGDLIIAIDKQPVATWEEMAKAIMGSEGRRLLFHLQRGDQVVQREITPGRRTQKNLFGEEIEGYVIGISNAGKFEVIPLGPVGALRESVVQTYTIAAFTVTTVVKLFQGRISPKTLGGPILIAQMSGQQAKAGLASLVSFMALISINLAILNFLPIPILDGGHLLFFFIELIAGRPLNLRIREIAQQAGLFILVLLMGFVFYNDIVRLVWPQ